MRSVTAKRPRVLLALLEKQEYVSTEQLERLGYTHPPRVAGDAKEHGIPIVTIKVRDSNGRSIGAYTLGDPAKMREETRGRKAFTKEFRQRMLAWISTQRGSPKQSGDQDFIPPSTEGRECLANWCAYYGALVR